MTASAETGGDDRAGDRGIEPPWRWLVAIAGLAALAPVFAAAAAAVGYTEPLDVAAQRAGATAAAAPSLLSGYAVPGLPSAVGTAAAAVGGGALTFAVTVAAGRLLATADE